jgi:hypothetical protein
MWEGDQAQRKQQGETEGWVGGELDEEAPPPKPQTKWLKLITLQPLETRQLNGCVIWGKLLYHSEPNFLSLKNEEGQLGNLYLL